jgi:1,2-diacylglycerol 3-alpha-glucosyltransferase
LKVLIVNPILYTSETRHIKRAPSIKDTMIYDLCLAFVEKGIDVTLAGAEDFKPTNQEEYPFKVIWMKTKFKKLLTPYVFPFCPEIKKIIKSTHYDLIISSEVISLNSLMLSAHSKSNLIIWQELAKHIKMMHQIPSHIWYGIIAKLFFKNTFIVPRSKEAKQFISKYCNNVSDTIVDHGVNLNKFEFCSEKENHFVICARLIKTKRIDRIILKFKEYLDKYDSSAKLYIIGWGDLEAPLKNYVSELNIDDNVIFTGRMSHDELLIKLKTAKALLIDTEKDNNMISVIESIAVGTPIITNTVPYNTTYIKSDKLGIVDDDWNADTINEVATNKEYIENCKSYRDKLSTLSRVDTFVKLSNELHNKD